LETRTREINADTERLNQRLRDIAQAVINDEDYSFDGDDTGRISPRRVSPIRGSDRFDSPERNFSRYVITNLNSSNALSRMNIRKKKHNFIIKNIYLSCHQ
jgi:hypothetical protein